MKPLDLVFWPAPVRHHPFEDHVRAAEAGGFTSLAIAPTTFSQARANGLSVADMKAMAEDHGVKLRHLDTLTSWAPFQLDSGDFDQEMNERWTTPLDRGLDICAELGLVQILATAAYQKAAVPLQQLIDGFGNLCERAGKLGIWVDLEPMPFFGCPTVADAWAVVGGAAQDNSGILMDSWHFFKAGQSLDALDGIPGRCLRTMQISDAPARQISQKLIDDTMKYRRWPEQGELPITEFIRAVHVKGHLQAIGQEVFSLEADAMPPEEAGRMAGKTAWEAYRKAGVPIPTRAVGNDMAG